MATKDELRAAKIEIEAKIETTAANHKAELLRWLIVTQLALAGIVAGIVELIHG